MLRVSYGEGNFPKNVDSNARIAIILYNNDNGNEDGDDYNGDDNDDGNDVNDGVKNDGDDRDDNVIDDDDDGYTGNNDNFGGNNRNNVDNDNHHHDNDGNNDDDIMRLIMVVMMMIMIVLVMVMIVVVMIMMVMIMVVMVRREKQPKKSVSYERIKIKLMYVKNCTWRHLCCHNPYMATLIVPQVMRVLPLPLYGYINCTSSYACVAITLIWLP
ncbi:hypothetical protein FHG87_007487 [Trinorchestia longiramus]|nr:hypothetical protein FHG87_007487 [Trinorchestia longiramus]